ncbi:MAG: universal stress protein [Armatimonadota bacterium]
MMADQQRSRSNDEKPTLLVGISNPETTGGLMDLAKSLAEHADYEVVATHILPVPPQAHLSSARGSGEMAAAREKLLEAIREAGARNVRARGVIEVAREVNEGLVSAAESQKASLILVGYSDPGDREEDGDGERSFDRVMHAVARNTEADLVVAKLRREEVGSILLPINTGLNLAVSGMLARAISREREAPVTLIHLLREDEEEDEARERLEANLDEEGLSDLGELVIEPLSDDVEPIDQLVEIASGYDMAIVGAEPRPSIAESVFGSWAERVAREADCTVLLVRAKSALEEE